MPAIIDIHPHIISDDESKYPPAPLFGKRSEWSKERPSNVEGLIAAMDRTGVAKAAIVQVSTCYGFDNSYLADSVARFPGRVTAVGSVDMVQPDAPKTIKKWLDRGISGLRMFLGGSTKAYDTSSLDDPRSFPAWELCGEAGVPIVLNIDTTGFAQTAGLAKRFPKVKIIIDHLGHTDLTDGAPYKKASCMFGLAPFENIYWKLTPTVFKYARGEKATPETFFPRMVEVFGSHRLAWGSDYPATKGELSEILGTARECVECLSAEDQAWIFGKTAQTLYPKLAD
jgi:predicted TIM-barrel fold metal-dependent hydrolase